MGESDFFITSRRCCFTYIWAYFNVGSRGQLHLEVSLPVAICQRRASLTNHRNLDWFITPCFCIGRYMSLALQMWAPLTEPVIQFWCRVLALMLFTPLSQEEKQFVCGGICFRLFRLQFFCGTWNWSWWSEVCGELIQPKANVRSQHVDSICFVRAKAHNRRIVGFLVLAYKRVEHMEHDGIRDGIQARFILHFKGDAK
jgi:hypothetical protein